MLIFGINCTHRLMALNWCDKED